MDVKVPQEAEVDRLTNSELEERYNSDGTHRFITLGIRAKLTKVEPGGKRTTSGARSTIPLATGTTTNAIP